MSEEDMGFSEPKFSRKTIPTIFSKKKKFKEDIKFPNL